MPRDSVLRKRVLVPFWVLEGADLLLLIGFTVYGLVSISQAKIQNEFPDNDYEYPYLDYYRAFGFISGDDNINWPIGYGPSPLEAQENLRRKILIINIVFLILEIIYSALFITTIVLLAKQKLSQVVNLTNTCIRFVFGLLFFFWELFEAGSFLTFIFTLVLCVLLLGQTIYNGIILHRFRMSRHVAA